MTRSWRSQWFNHPRHGPLPALLLLLTVATGVVDSVSILALGRVFIANMTGNVVFVGFALAGAPGFSLVASLLALAGFLLGAAAGGPITIRFRGSRGRLLAVVVTVELGLLAAAVVIAVIAGEPFAPAPRDLIVVTAAAALGLQNAANVRVVNLFTNADVPAQHNVGMLSIPLHLNAEETLALELK